MPTTLIPTIKSWTIFWQPYHILKNPYQLCLQHFQIKRDKGKAITFEEVKQNFLNLDEQLAREKSENGKDNRLHGKSYSAQKINKKLPRADKGNIQKNLWFQTWTKATTTAASTTTCYTCRSSGHYTNKCPNARQPQQNNSSKNNNKIKSTSKSSSYASIATSSNNNSSKQGDSPSTIVYGCSTLIIESCFMVCHLLNYNECPHLPKPYPYSYSLVNPDVPMNHLDNT